MIKINTIKSYNLINSNKNKPTLHHGNTTSVNALPSWMQNGCRAILYYVFS